MPGVTTRNRLANRASRGLIALLAVCQAMSIAITTVLPVPVAIFSADARQTGVVVGVLGLEPARGSRAAVASGDLGQEDRRLGGLALAEQDADPRGPGRPSAEQLPGDRRDPVVLLARHSSTSRADVVDQGVLLAALAGGVEVELLASPPTPCAPALAPDRHRDERLTRPATDLTASRPVGPMSKC